MTNVLRKTSVLFVCMGNICRSPTAEGVMRHKILQRGLGDAVTIASAGTHAHHIGSPPDNRSQAHALQRGIDMSAQRARRVAATDFADFDYILAMDHDNRAMLEAQCPQQHRRKVELMMRYAYKYSAQAEVPDPYYGGAAGFEAVLDYIEDACDGLIETINAGLTTSHSAAPDAKRGI